MNPTIKMTEKNIHFIQIKKDFDKLKFIIEFFLQETASSLGLFDTC